MWPDFADCMNCVSEKEYLEYCTWTIVQLDPHPIPNLKIFFQKKIIPRVVLMLWYAFLTCFLTLSCSVRSNFTASAGASSMPRL